MHDLNGSVSNRLIVRRTGRREFIRRLSVFIVLRFRSDLKIFIN